MNLKICKQCGTKFSTRYTKGVEQFCSRKCKLNARADLKHLDYVLRKNIVPCPDCRKPMLLERDGEGFSRLTCENENCDVIWIQGSQVIRSALNREKPDPLEVPYIINTLNLPQELYNSTRIIDYHSREEMVETVLSKNDYLTPTQEINLLCTLADQGFNLEKHEILLPVITWAERRLNLIAQNKMHSEAGVTIIVRTDECLKNGAVLLLFTKGVRCLELTKGERVKLASLLLRDIEESNIPQEPTLQKVLQLKRRNK